MSKAIAIEPSEGTACLQRKLTVRELAFFKKLQQLLDEYEMDITSKEWDMYLSHINPVTTIGPLNDGRVIDSDRLKMIINFAECNDGVQR